jgi:hypothetical protein
LIFNLAPGEDRGLAHRGRDRLGLRLLRLHRQLRRVGVRPHHLAAGPEEDLVAGLELPAQQRVRLLLRQVARGELVVVQHLHPPGAEPGARRPAGHRIEGVGGRPVDQRIAWDEREIRVGAGDLHRVVALGVLEEVAGAYLIEQALDEVQVALVVLDAVGPGRRRHRGEEDQRPRLGLVHQRLDDVLGRLLLEDPAVGGPRELPQPRHCLDPVGGVAAAEVARPGEATDDAVEVARLALLLLDGAGDGLAHQVVGLEVLGRRDRFGLDQERVGDRLPHPEAPQHELRPAGQARVPDPQQAWFLVDTRRHRRETSRRRSAGSAYPIRHRR